MGELFRSLNVDPQEFSGLIGSLSGDGLRKGQASYGGGGNNVMGLLGDVVTGGGGGGSSGGKKGFGKMLGDFAGNILRGKKKGGSGGGGGGGLDGILDGLNPGQFGGGGGANTAMDKLRGFLIGDKFPRIVGDLAHRFLGIDPSTGRIIGAMAGNVLFNLGGKDNSLGNIGKMVLDNIISGKWKRDVRPYTPPAPSPIQPGPMPSDPGEPMPVPDAEAGDAQEFHSLRQQCLDERRLFEDPEFPATDSSLFYSRSAGRSIVWKRPGEITDNPMLFAEGHSRFDVKQGELGDCWMLAAIATLTLRDELFYRVVPPDQSFTENYAGIFHFQFWQYGQWVDVVIDDRLPTSGGKLCYLHSESMNEFWSPLVEKAYAKLHGSYEALKGGTTCEALEDFTGGITELINLQENPPKNLLSMMFRAFNMGSLLGCSIQGKPGQVGEGRLGNGLLSGHAYSITGAKIVNGPGGQTALLRIRNPWGNEHEWRGAWSDGSSEWQYISDGEKQGMGLVFAHDGEFWMSFEDFARNFETLEICNLGPEVVEEIATMTGADPTIGSDDWTTHSQNGRWISGQTAGGCRNYIDTFPTNPQLAIKLTDPDPDDDDNLCTCIIGVIQKYRRQLRARGLDMLNIGFAVYQMDEEPSGRNERGFFETNKSCARSPVFINLREVSARFRFPPGFYVLIPSTFEPNQEGDFMVRIFTDKPSFTKGLT